MKISRIAPNRDELPLVAGFVVKRLLSVGIAVMVAWIAPSAHSQTLTQQLIQENSAKLVEDARKSGDIVRGAILFHQGNINCAKCHRPAAEKDRIGPDLSRMGQEATDNSTDNSIVEAILQPSKTIKKGYESTIIVTQQGQVITGTIVSQNDSQLVLRNSQNVDQVITVDRQDIDESRPSPMSSMPDGLTNELKNRQQFLDLLRYVIDLKERGPVADAVKISGVVRRELSDELMGWVLIDKLNCVACHPTTHSVAALSAKPAPNLKWCASNLNPAHLAKFIADPQQMKPGAMMPHMLGHLNESARQEAAEAIVKYLVSLEGNHFQSTADSVPDVDVVLRGDELFHSVGCVACHAPRNKNGNEQPLSDSIPLGDLRGKYDSIALTAFLENPHAARPSGRMPNMVLTHREALDLSSFLLQETDPLPVVPKYLWQDDSALAAKGKQLFSELNCNKCHTSFSNNDSSQSTLATQLPLEKLDLEKGCLSGEQSTTPNFQFSSEDQHRIRAALKSTSKELTSAQQIDLTLVSFNCVACHRRDQLGGVPDDRSEYFQTTNLNLGEQGRIPPTLTGVGAKLKAKWMRDVLVNHRSIRPYMKTRMPQYGESSIGHLIDLFQTTDHLSETKFAAVEDQKEMRKQGLELVGNRGLNCVACHTYQYKISDTMPAVDLTEMAERLKKDWFYQYMHAPQKFSPNTVMPSYWPNGKAIRADIAGDSDSQVESIWQYLLDGRQANAPAGVIREPLEIVIGSEARMLRRSYPDIGKRGIGVGYPGGVNIAFDAEQMRLAFLWKGKFVDPAGVWYGQGNGNVRPLGPTIKLPSGPELDDQNDPWIVSDGRPPKHHFQGYVLDEARRPTFLYAFDSVEVEDYCSEFTDDSDGTIQLRRRIKMKSAQPRGDLRFRVAAGSEIAAGSEMAAESDQSVVIDGRLTVNIISDHIATVVDEGEGKVVYVPITFDDNQDQELVIEYSWSDKSP